MLRKAGRGPRSKMLSLVTVLSRGTKMSLGRHHSHAPADRKSQFCSRCVSPNAGVFFGRPMHDNNDLVKNARVSLLRRPGVNITFSGRPINQCQLRNWALLAVDVLLLSERWQFAALQKVVPTRDSLCARQKVQWRLRLIAHSEYVLFMIWPKLATM